MKSFLSFLLVTSTFIGTVAGFSTAHALDSSLVESYFFTPEIETDKITYLYTAPQPSLCFHPDDVTIRIVMYHYIREPERDPSDSNISRNSLSPASFEIHARALSNAQKQGSTRLIFMSQLKQAFDTKCFPHDNLIILTADDGWRDNYGKMFPILKEYAIKMNLGIVTDKIIDGKRLDPFMTKSELDEMVSSGLIEVQSHTRTHRDLRELSIENLQYELCQSKTILENRYGKTITTIVYPVGKYDQAALKVAESCGYSFGLTTHYGTVTPEEITTHPFTMERIRVTKETTVKEIIGF